MKYKVSVVMSYWQTIEVEAESRDDARSIALDAFDISKALSILVKPSLVMAKHMT